MELINKKTDKTFTDSDVNFWPGFIDVFVSILMIFFLIAFLRLTINTEAFEMLTLKSHQDQVEEEFRMEFKKEMEEKKIRILTQGNFQQITFSSEILFDSGDAKLSKRGGRLLGRLILILDYVEKTAKFKQIQVEGHTDNVSISGELMKRFPTNWELSAQRAINVVRYFYVFIENGLVKLNRSLFSGTGYAFFRPAATNETLEGRALNRRIEIRIVYFNDLKVKE